MVRKADATPLRRLRWLQPHELRSALLAAQVLDLTCNGAPFAAACPQRPARVPAFVIPGLMHHVPAPQPLYELVCSG